MHVLLVHFTKRNMAHRVLLGYCFAVPHFSQFSLLDVENQTLAMSLLPPMFHRRRVVSQWLRRFPLFRCSGRSTAFHEPFHLSFVVHSLCMPEGEITRPQTTGTDGKRKGGGSENKKEKDGGTRTFTHVCLVCAKCDCAAVSNTTKSTSQKQIHDFRAWYFCG